MVETTAPANPNPLSGIKTRVGHFFRGMIQPNTLSFNLTVAAVAGTLTALFGTIILLMVMVAANFNILQFIE